MKKHYILLSFIIILIYTACSDGIVPSSIKSYPVSYIANGASSGSLLVAEYPEGDIVSAETQGSLVKAGYTLISWNTEADGLGAGYAPGLGFIMPSEELNLYAQWINDDYTAMISVPGGVYPASENGPLIKFDHRVSAFDIGEYEVTYELWYHVYRFALTKGYHFQHSGIEGTEGNGIEGSPPDPLSSEKPVTNINWRDAMVWVNAYNELKGLDLVYTYGDEAVKDSRDSNFIKCDNAVYKSDPSGSYSLQTEGQWQYAAAYNGNMTTFESIWRDSTQNIASDFVKNMVDSTMEWCWDRYSPLDDLTTTQFDFQGPTSGSSQRMRRGGSGGDSDPYSISYRESTNPYSLGNLTSLRITFRR